MESSPVADSVSVSPQDSKSPLSPAPTPSEAIEGSAASVQETIENLNNFLLQSSETLPTPVLSPSLPVSDQIMSADDFESMLLTSSEPVSEEVNLKDFLLPEPLQPSTVVEPEVPAEEMSSVPVTEEELLLMMLGQESGQEMKKDEIPIPMEVKKEVEEEPPVAAEEEEHADEDQPVATPEEEEKNEDLVIDIKDDEDADNVPDPEKASSRPKRSTGRDKDKNRDKKDTSSRYNNKNSKNNFKYNNNNKGKIERVPCIFCFFL